MEDKALKGSGLGFVLTFFLGLIGFILCLVLGDQKCKKASIITFIISLALPVVVGIGYVIIVIVIGGAAAIGSGSLFLALL